jgi:hypothetical protein
MCICNLFATDTFKAMQVVKAMQNTSTVLYFWHYVQLIYASYLLYHVLCFVTSRANI